MWASDQPLEARAVGANEHACRGEMTIVEAVPAGCRDRGVDDRDLGDLVSLRKPSKVANPSSVQR
jgi:hypothetical protein